MTANANARVLALDNLMIGPQPPASPLVGRLLTAQEVDQVVGAYSLPCDPDYVQYPQGTYEKVCS